VSYRSCPSCGFLVGLDADRCPLCSEAVEPAPQPLPGAEGAGDRDRAGDGAGFEPFGALAPEQGGPAWPAVPGADDRLEGDGTLRPPAAPRESPAVPLTVAAVSLVAMLGLTLFGNTVRAAQAEGPVVTLPDPEVVAASLPTTIPPGWATATDTAGTFLVSLPGPAGSGDDVDGQGRTVHHVRATTADGAYELAWLDAPAQPTGAELAAWLEAEARAVVPPDATEVTAAPTTLAGQPGVLVRYRSADGGLGLVTTVGHGDRLWRLSAAGPAADAVQHDADRVAGGLVLP
jgi:hypothetical protein